MTIKDEGVSGGGAQLKANLGRVLRICYSSLRSFQSKVPIGRLEYNISKFVKFVISFIFGESIQKCYLFHFSYTGYEFNESVFTWTIELAKNAGSVLVVNNMDLLKRLKELRSRHPLADSPYYVLVPKNTPCFGVTITKDGVRKL